jgi:hypothetical protein
VTEPDDTAYYSYKSIKSVARWAIDIKKMIPIAALRKEDLRIYGEVAVLDWVGQDTLYKRSALNERIPLMAGLNVPTHPFISYGAMTALEALTLLPVERNLFRDKLNILNSTRFLSTSFTA